MASVAAAQTEHNQRWGDRVAIEPPSIKLYSNHCYRNASYAALFHMPELMDILEENHPHCEDPEPCLKCALHELAEHYWNPDVDELDEKVRGSVFKTFTTFLNAFDSDLRYIERAKPSGEAGDTDDDDELEAQKRSTAGMQKLNMGQAAQQDAAEFINKMLINLAPNDNDPTTRTAMMLLFLLQLVNSWTCEVCGTKYSLRDGETHDERGIVPVQVLDRRNPKPRPLDYFLDRKLFTHILEDRICETCVLSTDNFLESEKHRRSVEEIITAPEVLVLQLKIIRWEKFVDEEGKPFDEPIKRDPKVQIPLLLDLTKYVDKESYKGLKGNLRYKLCSTIYHNGTPNSGHYHGVFVGPKGVRRIDDYVWEGHASNLTAHYPFPNSQEAFDRYGNRNQEPATTKTLPRPQKITDDRLDGCGDPLPYLLVYRKMTRPSQKRARTSSSPSSPSKRSSPSRKTRSTSSARTEKSSVSARRSKSRSASASKSQSPTSTKGATTSRRTSPRHTV